MSKTDDYNHPESGRIYRQGDPAHHFALLVAALARECSEFIRHHDDRLTGRDYLDQAMTWPSDPQRIAGSMTRTLEAIDKAWTAMVYDMDAPSWGLGSKDEEWQRKYGTRREPTARKMT